MASIASSAPPPTKSHRPYSLSQVHSGSGSGWRNVALRWRRAWRPGKVMILRCNITGDLYPPRPSPEINKAASTVSVDLWHRLLGHPAGQASLSTVLNYFPLIGYSCLSCLSARQTHAAFFQCHLQLQYSFSFPVTSLRCMDFSNSKQFRAHLMLLDD